MGSSEAFKQLDIRVGKIIDAQDFLEARNPSYKLKVDFGLEIGVKKSCAQLVKNYTKEELVGRLVLGVVNFPARQIGPAVSEVLVLGVPDEEGNCVLVQPATKVPIGRKMY